MQLELPVEDFLAVGTLRFPHLGRNRLFATFRTGDKDGFSRIDTTLYRE
jgi:hypothetical protein